MNSTTIHSLASKWLPPDSINDRQAAAMQCLLDCQQHALFEAWDPPGHRDEEKRAFLDQVADLNDRLIGGLKGYLDRARQLLNHQNDSPYDNVLIEHPPVNDLTQLDTAYEHKEMQGLELGDRLAFVLVAGGLGERLGYGGIKMEIPFEITSYTTYMQLYCQFILALQQRTAERLNRPDLRVPFLIMTSDGTNARLKAYLEENSYFGLDRDHVHLFEQTLVPAVSDKNATLATQGPYQLILKPGGHGDVHQQLHTRGYAKMLKDLGKTHLVFLQDTNAQVTNLILPAVGVSAEHGYAFNFVCVPRVPREPIGAVVKLISDEGERTVNIEYNQLEAFFKAKGMAGDQPDDTGFSPYPGNINLLVVELAPYIQVLERTGGLVAEFINPKYADESKETFLTPTRVETLMQDLAGSYPPGTPIGVTLFNRDWALAALKNSLPSAQAKARAGQPSYSATAAESAYYQSQRIRLKLAGVDVGSEKKTTFHDIPFLDGARVVMSPLFSLVLTDTRHNIEGGQLSPHASLVIEGRDITLRNINLSGTSALVIRACDGAHVAVDGLTLNEPGYTFEPLPDNALQDPDTPAYLRIRGYRRITHKPAVYEFDQPGQYRIDSKGRVTRD